MESAPPPIVSSFWQLIDMGGCKSHRIEARGAEAADLHARKTASPSLLAAPRSAQCRAGSQTGATTPRITSSTTSSGQDCYGSLRAFKRGMDHGGQAQARHFVQRSIGLAATARRLRTR